MEDADLARAIAGSATAIDAAAEAEFCRRFAPRVRLYGLRHLRDRHAAADLVQQVLMMTLERLRAGKLRDPERLASFVLGTCRMVVMDQRRGAARRGALLELYGGSESRIDRVAVAFDIRGLDGVTRLTKRVSPATAGGDFRRVAFAQLPVGRLGPGSYQLYANVLHRAPDGGGLGYWVGNLSSAAIDRAGVLMYFSESAENQGALSGVIQDGMAYV